MKLVKFMQSFKNGSSSRAIDSIYKSADTAQSINSINPGSFTNTNNNFWQR